MFSVLPFWSYYFFRSCSSSNTSANVGQNTIALNELNTGTYTNCRLQVTGSPGTYSNNLRLNNFTISEPCDDSDNISPILSESVRIGLSTDNNTNVTTQITYLLPMKVEL